MCLSELCEECANHAVISSFAFVDVTVLIVSRSSLLGAIRLRALVVPHPLTLFERHSLEIAALSTVDRHHALTTAAVVGYLYIAPSAQMTTRRAM